MELADVRDYWQADPCAAKLARHEPGTKEFYAEIEAAKNRIEPYEAEFSDFAAWSGRKVLEIGCGVGIDTARFARAGAEITAIDLTEAGVSLANQLLQLEGLSGEAVVGNAEELPFPDETFDLAYSWGVLHHTPNTAKAVAEARRVLKPGGELRMMLYSRRSTFALAVWGRQVLRERRFMSAKTALAGGLESPGTQAFTPREAAGLVRGFESVRIEQKMTRYDRLPMRIDVLGWHLLIRAHRPNTPD
jgi:SAM-dependent methyltransferase